MGDKAADEQATDATQSALGVVLKQYEARREREANVSLARRELERAEARLEAAQARVDAAKALLAFLANNAEVTSVEPRSDTQPVANLRQRMAHEARWERAEQDGEPAVSVEALSPQELVFVVDYIHQHIDHTGFAVLATSTWDASTEATWLAATFVFARQEHAERLLGAVGDWAKNIFVAGTPPALVTADWIAFLLRGGAIERSAGHQLRRLMAILRDLADVLDSPRDAGDRIANAKVLLEWLPA